MSNGQAGEAVAERLQALGAPRVLVQMAFPSARARRVMIPRPRGA
jgi:hypothetical protein